MILMASTFKKSRCAKYIRTKVLPVMVRDDPANQIHHAISLKARYISRDIKVDPWGKLSDQSKDTSGRHMAYYSLFLAMVAQHEMTDQSKYKCKDCKQTHFREPMFFEFVTNYRYFAKPRVHKIIELIANENYI